VISCVVVIKDSCLVVALAKTDDLHLGAAFWTKQGVDFIDTLNGSASSPPVSIAQVFEMVFLSGISEMVVVSSEQHSLRLFPRVLAE